MFPNASASAGQFYVMPQQNTGFQSTGFQGTGFQSIVPNLATGSSQQSTDTSSLGLGLPQQSAGLGQAQSDMGSIDVNQLVTAIFQPVVDLLNMALSGGIGTEQTTSGMSGGQLPTSGQSVGLSYGDAQFSGGQNSLTSQSGQTDGSTQVWGQSATQSGTQTSTQEGVQGGQTYDPTQVCGQSSTQSGTQNPTQEGDTSNGQGTSCEPAVQGTTDNGSSSASSATEGDGKHCC